MRLNLFKIAIITMAGGLFLNLSPEAKAFLLYQSDFEDGAPDWTTSGLWHLTDPSNAFSEFRSAQHSMWYGQDSSGNYNTGEANTGTLTGPPVDLAGLISADFSFWTFWEIESVDPPAYDLMIVEVSTDGGSTWTEIQRLNPAADPPGGSGSIGFSNNGFGEDPSWKKIVYNLDAYLDQVIEIRFRFDSRDALYQDHRGWYIDDFQVEGESPPPSRTPTPFPEPTLEPSPSDTTTPSSTHTQTFTPSHTLSYTLSFSPTSTPSHTLSHTLSFSPSWTLTYSPTWSPTNTRTQTSTDTKTQTITVSPSHTPTQTPSHTPSFSPSRTATYTFTHSHSHTQTHSPTFTRTATPTSTASFTPTSTPTDSPTRSHSQTFTFTMTFTNTPSRTRSETPSNTLTHTPSFTSSSTSSHTQTTTLTQTPSHTPTSTPSFTLTFTASNTRTFTPSRTLTFTPSHTPSFSPTLTSTSSFTVTLTDTLTATPSASFTVTFTPTDSPTATATATSTATASFSATWSPSSTMTPTPTVTPTFSMTSTYTWSQTYTSSSTASPTYTVTPTYTKTPKDLVRVSVSLFNEAGERILILAQDLVREAPVLAASLPLGSVYREAPFRIVIHDERDTVVLDWSGQSPFPGEYILQVRSVDSVGQETIINLQITIFLDGSYLNFRVFGESGELVYSWSAEGLPLKPGTDVAFSTEVLVPGETLEITGPWPTPIRFNGRTNSDRILAPGTYLLQVSWRLPSSLEKMITGTLTIFPFSPSGVGVKIAPNPYLPGSGVWVRIWTQPPLHQGEVAIMTLNGENVVSLPLDAGQCLWDGSTEGLGRAASGLYIILVRGIDSEGRAVQLQGRLALIK